MKTTIDTPQGPARLGIVPQTQPNDVTCVQTCLAMALGVPGSTLAARLIGRTPQLTALPGAETNRKHTGYD